MVLDIVLDMVVDIVLDMVVDMVVGGGNGVGHAGGGHGVGHAGGCSSSWWTWWLFCFEGGSRCMLVVPQR